ncbi:MAG: hypothetical protein EU530_00495 [Promethearchaeota archaeon]|nr:MAG: hypothetical protein EU530_00495 [Candidatus Lokiarchaeota archaeon]
MSTQDETIVGKKGEILPKKALRELSGITPGDKVIIEASPGVLTVKKVYSVEELLKMPKIAHGTPDELEQEINEEGKKHEELVAK